MPFLVPVDVSPRVRTALSDFVPDEGNFTPPYFRIASEIHEIWRKICKRDVREGILDRLLASMDVKAAKIA